MLALESNLLPARPLLLQVESQRFGFKGDFSNGSSTLAAFFQGWWWQVPAFLLMLCVWLLFCSWMQAGTEHKWMLEARRFPPYYPTSASSTDPVEGKKPTGHSGLKEPKGVRSRGEHPLDHYALLWCGGEPSADSLFKLVET